MFTQALENFIPVSLKGVKLLKSETTWEDVGGMHVNNHRDLLSILITIKGMENVKLLLKETFEWPTKYQSVFSKCPLKLRKGFAYLTIIQLHLLTIY